MRILRVLVLVCTAGCYQPWPFSGPYQCSAGSCPDGLVCDDGLCCQPGGEPSCRTLVLDAGTCPGPERPKLYFEDLDRDGYGNPKASKLLCGRPMIDPFVDNPLDCDDNSAEVNPKSAEKCDGLDNNCDGTIDEGLMPLTTYFRDEDGDGFGNPASSVVACAKPAGFVESNNDCAPSAITVHPSAPELCNGIDDDCNNLKDDNVTDVGLDCVGAGKGECNAGRTACVAGVKVCQSLKVPKPDICDTLDNNCNGRVDEQPDCGGPADFLDSGVPGGAQTMNKSLSSMELTQGCHKDFPGATGESWSAPKWTGSGGADHLFFIENPSGVWDLSKPGLKLKLDLSWTMVSPQTPPWQPSSQPVVFLCSGPTGQSSFNRYVHGAADGGVPPAGYLMTTSTGNFSEEIPIASGNAWVLGNGSGADLTQVKRIELLVRPTGPVSSSTPAFTFTVGAQSGFSP
jgi:hypothetical protein